MDKSPSEKERYSFLRLRLHVASQIQKWLSPSASITLQSGSVCVLKFKVGKFAPRPQLGRLVLVSGADAEYTQMSDSAPTAPASALASTQRLHSPHIFD